jgi:hypothetical protein
MLWGVTCTFLSIQFFSHFNWEEPSRIWFKQNRNVILNWKSKKRVEYSEWRLTFKMIDWTDTEINQKQTTFIYFIETLSVSVFVNYCNIIFTKKNGNVAFSFFFFFSLTFLDIFCFFKQTKNILFWIRNHKWIAQILRYAIFFWKKKLHFWGIFFFVCYEIFIFFWHIWSLLIHFFVLKIINFRVGVASWKKWTI